MMMVISFTAPKTLFDAVVRCGNALLISHRIFFTHKEGVVRLLVSLITVILPRAGVAIETASRVADPALTCVYASWDDNRLCTPLSLSLSRSLSLSLFLSRLCLL